MCILVNLVCCIHSNSPIPSSRIIVRSLSQNGKAKLEWFEQPYIKLNTSSLDKNLVFQSTQTAPLNKPKVKLLYNTDSFAFENPIVDSEGCIWYFSITPLTSESDSKQTTERKILRLNIDGSLLWEKTLRNDQIYPPIAMLDSAIVICNQFSEGSSIFSPEYICLECLDYNFDLIWRTESIRDYYYKPCSWEISNNRLIMPEGGINSGKFRIYGIENGELIDHIAFAKLKQFYKIADSPYVFDIGEKGWLVLIGNQLIRFGSGFELLWKYEIKQSLTEPEIAISSSDVILVVISNEISALDIITGKLLWENKKGDNFKLAGLKDENEFLIFKTSYSMHGLNNHLESAYEYSFASIDKNGKELWSIPLDNIYDNVSTIVYEDGHVIFNYRSGLIMVDSKGKMVWKLTKNDFSCSEEWGLLNMFISPAPDDKIIVSFLKPSNSEYSLFLLSEPEGK